MNLSRKIAAALDEPAPPDSAGPVTVSAEDGPCRLALQVELSPADLARIEEAVPASAVAGTRYGEPQMRMLDSER